MDDVLSAYPLVTSTADGIMVVEGTRVDAICTRAASIPDVVSVAMTFGISEEAVRQALAYAARTKHRLEGTRSAMPTRLALAPSVRRRASQPIFSYPRGA